MISALKVSDLITSSGNGIVDAIILFMVSLAIIIGCGVYLYTVKLKPWFASLKTDTSVIREHTENNHSGAANPNLRDDLDAKHHEITSQLRIVVTTLEDLDRSQRRVDSELSRVHSEVGSLRTDIAVERSRINRMMEK